MEVNIVLDTNRYSDLARGVPGVVSVVNSSARVFIPFVVLAELRCGFALGARARENEAALEEFLKQPHFSVLYADEITTQIYAQVYA